MRWPIMNYRFCILKKVIKQSCLCIFPKLNPITKITRFPKSISNKMVRQCFFYYLTRKMIGWLCVKKMDINAHIGFFLLLRVPQFLLSRNWNFNFADGNFQFRAQWISNFAQEIILNLRRIIFKFASCFFYICGLVIIVYE